MNIRPGAHQQAERMTADLFRLFQQNYLSSKYFDITNFICDYIEDENGLVYLLQVKYFECDKKEITPRIRPQMQSTATKPTLTEKCCQAMIICVDQVASKILEEYFNRHDAGRALERDEFYLIRQKTVERY